jgi:hypothetical protein
VLSLYDCARFKQSYSPIASAALLETTGLAGSATALTATYLAREVLGTATAAVRVARCRWLARLEEVRRQRAIAAALEDQKTGNRLLDEGSSVVVSISYCCENVSGVTRRVTDLTHSQMYASQFPLSTS